MYHKSQKILYQPPHPSPTTHIITPPTSHKAPLSSSVLLRQQYCLCEALKNLFCTFTHWLYGPAFGELFSSVCVCVCVWSVTCHIPRMQSSVKGSGPTSPEVQEGGGGEQSDWWLRGRRPKGWMCRGNIQWADLVICNVVTSPSL